MSSAAIVIDPLGVNKPASAKETLPVSAMPKFKLMFLRLSIKIILTNLHQAKETLPESAMPKFKLMFLRLSIKIILTNLHQAKETLPVLAMP